MARSSGKVFVKLIPVTADGRRLNPVLPEAGSGNAAARNPVLFCQFKVLGCAGKAPVAANSIAAQIVVLLRRIATARGRFRSSLQTKEAQCLPENQGLKFVLVASDGLR